MSFSAVFAADEIDVADLAGNQSFGQCQDLDHGLNGGARSQLWPA